MIPLVVRTVNALKMAVTSWRQENLTVALIPTMGALHEGHIALVKEGTRCANRVIVSIFVNPVQFESRDDLLRYPRQESEDIIKLVNIGTHLIFVPTEQVMYPTDFSTRVTVSGVADYLCGVCRPGHFSGVATIVTKLLLQSLPDVAIFGEKDYQQLQIIKRLITDLDIPVRVISVPTVRAEDGLALSSRNSYLSTDERRRAPALYQAICKMAAKIAAGTDFNAATAIARQQILDAGFNTIDYLVVCDSTTMSPLIEPCSKSLRVLVAAWLGQTRLIDNTPVSWFSSEEKE